MAHSFCSHQVPAEKRITNFNVRTSVLKTKTDHNVRAPWKQKLQGPGLVGQNIRYTYSAFVPTGTLSKNW